MGISCERCVPHFIENRYITKEDFKNFLNELCGDVGRLVLTHKDRLLRLGAELVFAMCAEFETEVIIINTAYEYRETGFLEQNQ